MRFKRIDFASLSTRAERSYETLAVHEKSMKEGGAGARFERLST